MIERAVLTAPLANPRRHIARGAAGACWLSAGILFFDSVLSTFSLGQIFRILPARLPAGSTQRIFREQSQRPS